MTSVRMLIGFTILTLASSLEAGESRKFTDSKGISMTGELVKVTDKNEAVIKDKDGREYTIPVERFSEEDQAYFHEQKLLSQQKSAQAAPPEDQLFDERIWTDSKGNTIRAKFVRMHEGDVILKRDSKAHKVPFNDLSAADQAFLRKALALEDKSESLPDCAAPSAEMTPSCSPVECGCGFSLRTRPSRCRRLRSVRSCTCR